ncbi:hypothetical protein L798_03480 [Zootermopsis nevadensis]|uniref:Gustatory receptor n=1 Tax=Zootermopsis nevadensis TaxID=136037 RepID=A0A067RFL0_ZOONE|nr:hypothetical protein L798_03480 [Zootermopsis nevadensis]
MSQICPENGGMHFLRHSKLTAITSTHAVYLQQFTLTDKHYFNQMKPILRAMKYSGILPITIPKSGTPTFRVLSLVMAYSVCIHIWVLIMAYFNACDILLKLLERRGDFLTHIFSALYMNALVFSGCLPVLMWLDCHKFVTYMDEWIRFQVLFLRVTGDDLSLSLKRQCFVYSLYVSFMTVVALGLNIHEQYFPLWRMPIFYIMLLQLNLLSTFRGVTFSALKITSCTLARRFKRCMTERVSAQEVEGYRILWLRLSHLVLQTGEAMGKVWALLSIIFISIQTLSLYGCLSNLVGKQGDVSKAVGMGLGSGFGLISVYIWCNEAQNIEQCVRSEVQESLQTIRLQLHSRAVNAEVNAFLQTISLYPPVISVLGFKDINRGLFRSIIATLLTYLIVILQFDTGRHSKSCDLSTTRSV